MRALLRFSMIVFLVGCGLNNPFGADEPDLPPCDDPTVTDPANFPESQAEAEQWLRALWACYDVHYEHIECEPLVTDENWPCEQPGICWAHYPCQGCPAIVNRPTEQLPCDLLGANAGDGAQ
ncbi:MAG: hypothetical protein KC613_23385 [Myxococcales bacterium]|nr:hypothetical protein [Myxococcales bacterium]